MAHHFVDQEAAVWLKKQARKPMSAKVILCNSGGEMLIVKPNYKPGWFFVGGMVSENESPLQAVLRETEEETNIRLQIEQLRFLGVRYGISKRGGGDFLHFIFYATLTESQVKQVRISEEELQDSKWVRSAGQHPEILDHISVFFQRLQQGMSQASYADQDSIFIPSSGMSS